MPFATLAVGLLPVLPYHGLMPLPGPIGCINNKGELILCRYFGYEAR